MEAIANPAFPKRIALFSDGTGNSSAKAHKTNVWRLYQALDQGNGHQIAKYDDGGTSANKYVAALRGAFGWGLKRSVIELYKFVCRNYTLGDDIYGFGFSRGAFTIRALVGLIAREGLVTFLSEEELDRHAAAAYRSYRRKAFPSKSPIVWLSRMFRDIILNAKNVILGHAVYGRVAETTKSAQRDQIPIRFLGLWDTVEAYEMLSEELRRAVDLVLWPMRFADLKLAACVKRAVHALSLDDERETFHPLLWDEEWEAELRLVNPSAPSRVTQMWFAGVHSNVGGGYSEDQLSLIPLEWIMREAAKHGLALDPERSAKIVAAKSPYARLYDSRAGLNVYYRYAPRQTPALRYRGMPIHANVHWSVLLRMAYGADNYAPIALPHVFNVSTPNGDLLNFEDLSQSVRGGGTITTKNAELDTAIKELSNPNEDEVGLVWDAVFWRRCLNALTVCMVLCAVAFPFISILLPAQLAFSDVVVRGPITTVVNALDGLIPSGAIIWKDALEHYPLEFGLLLVTIAITLIKRQAVGARIHELARVVWHPGRLERYRQWDKETRRNQGRRLIACLILLAAASVAFPVVGTPDVEPVVAIIAASLTLAYGASSFWRRKKRGVPVPRIRGPLSLETARVIRKNHTLIWLYGGLSRICVPLAFGGLLVVIGAVLTNRVIFDRASSAGVYCPESSMGRPEMPMEQLDDSSRYFTTDRMCWPSGLWLIQGNRYRITIGTVTARATDRWFDRDVPTDVMGFTTDSVRRGLARPLTRWWQENWFQPIARIGPTGNDEYVLKPINDLADPSPSHCPDMPHLPPGLPIRTKIDEALAWEINECAPQPVSRRVLSSEITARTSGELFVYVNDAILALPGVSDLFYANNSGRATVRVDRVARLEDVLAQGQSNNEVPIAKFTITGQILRTVGEWLPLLFVINVALLFAARRSTWAWRIATDNGLATTPLRISMFVMSHARSAQLWILDLYFQRRKLATGFPPPFLRLPLKYGESVSESSDRVVSPPWNKKRLWIQGNSGMGKTALFRHITAAHFRESVTSFDAFKTWGAVVIAFSARDFAGVGDDEFDPTWVVDAVRVTLTARGLGFENDGLLRKILASGTIAVAIDGLHEANRAKAVEAFTRNFPDVAMLVTSQDPGGDQFTTWRLPSDMRAFTDDLIRKYLEKSAADIVIERIKSSGLKDSIRSGYDARLIIDLVRGDPAGALMPSDLMGLYSAVVRAAWPMASEEVMREQQERTAAAAWRMVSERKPNEDKRRLKPEIDLDARLLGLLAAAAERDGKPVRLIRQVGEAFEFVHDQMHSYLAARWFTQVGFTVAKLEKMVAESSIWGDTKSAREMLWTFAAALLDDDRLVALWVRVDDQEEWGILRIALKREAERRGLRFPSAGAAQVPS